MEDYYSVLRLPSSASAEEIKRAFLREIQTWHPDRNPSIEAPRRTQLILEARSILFDPPKRTAYDKALIAGSGHVVQDAEKVPKWQEQAQAYARESAKKPLDEILRQAVVGTAKWLTGATIGVGAALKAVAIVLGVTRASGGFEAPYAGFIYWGTSFAVYAGVLLMGYWAKKRLFSLQCEHCAKLVEILQVCPGCGQSGCFKCVGVPLEMRAVLRGGKVAYRCKACNAVLRHVQKKSRLRDWVR